MKRNSYLEKRVMYGNIPIYVEPDQRDEVIPKCQQYVSNYLKLTEMHRDKVHMQ